jgi:hypothetical protein
MFYSCNVNGSITGLSLRTTASTGGHLAKSFLPVDMSTHAAFAQVIASHGMVVVATALDVTPTTPSGGGDMRVGAGGAEAEVATVDVVAVGVAKIRVDREGVQVSPCVLALDTRQACAMR